AVARPPPWTDRPVRGQRAERREPSRRRVDGEPLHPLEHAVGAPVSLDELPVRLKPGLEGERAVEDGLDDPAALTTEIEGGADALRGERQALTGGVADGEHPPRRRTPQPVGEVRAVVGARRAGLRRWGAVESRPQLRPADVGAEPDEAALADRENPAETLGNHRLVEQEPEAIVPAERGMRLEPERVPATARVRGEAIHDG